MEAVRGPVVCQSPSSTHEPPSRAKLEANAARNRGDLAAGWYDPATLQKSAAAAREYERAPLPSPPPHADRRERDGRGDAGVDDEDGSEDEDLGPAPPPPPLNSHPRAGPAIPRTSDLRLRDEELAEASADSRSLVRAARKEDKKLQRERLEELVPRAEPGSRDRQLEKKREVAATNRSFADAKGGADGLADVSEEVAMGGGDGGIREMKAREERKKNEREIRREEILRARQAEREERMVGLRQKEEKTMEMLRELAKQRFG